MMKEEVISKLKKSKSMCDVTGSVHHDAGDYIKDSFYDNRRQRSTSVDSSLEMVTMDSGSEGRAPAQLADSGLDHTLDGHGLAVLEHKIDRLTDMFQEQCRLLATLKEDIRISKAAVDSAEQYQTDIVADFVTKTLFERNVKEVNASEASESNSRAQSLLAAIEARQGSSVDREVRDALASFLQSDELREHMVCATAESVRGVVGDCISRDLAALYLPMLEHSHRRLVRTVSKTIEDAFTELEENSASLSRSLYKISRSLRRSIERHQHLMEAAADPQKNLIATFKCTVEELLHEELKQWRQKVLHVFADIQATPGEPPESTPLDSAPPSPLEPAGTERALIDQLMMAAEITNQIAAGDVNDAFERALSASDLSVVTAACRQGAAVAFVPHCRLHQHVLLALLQQLSTDMLQDTLLKCRYLEDSIMNLDRGNAATRAHLPLVVGEVRKHLTKFVASYPGHVASRRIALIIMAADNLLK